MAGYQLKPATRMKIKKAKSDGYTFKFDVVYSKNGKANTATIIGDIDTSDDGKVVSIDIINDGGLIKTMNLKTSTHHGK